MEGLSHPLPPRYGSLLGWRKSSALRERSQDGSVSATPDAIRWAAWEHRTYQDRIAALMRDDNYRMDEAVLHKLHTCIRCYCLGEVCDDCPQYGEVGGGFPGHQTGPFAPVEHWTQKALRWSMTWMLVFVGIALLMLIGA